MTSDQNYETTLLYYRKDPYRLKPVQHEDGIWALDSRDGKMSIQPWSFGGGIVCLCITDTPTSTARRALDRLRAEHLELCPVEGKNTPGESVHTFRHTAQGVMTIARVLKLPRRRQLTPAHREAAIRATAPYRFQKDTLLNS